ncbi:hypothetical protein I4U23_008308 [Adineta vaga]|nr:hypothetical protein I4U23_008308 [Adineta vaga]
MFNKEKTKALVLKSDRTEFDCELMEKAILVWEELLDEAAAKFNEKQHPKQHSVSDYLLEHFKERLIASISCSNHIIDALIDYFDKLELIENGCLTLSDLSLTEYGSFEYLDGDSGYEMLNGGYRPFISYMKSFLTDEKRIHLNSEVIQVKYLKEDHQLQIDIRDLSQTSPNEITTIRCDHIIWTSSLGHLKENFFSIFANEKELIEQKRDAIENLGFDTVNKVILIYEKRFWPENVKEIIVLHTEKQPIIDLSNLLKELLDSTNIDVQTIRIIIEGIHRYDILPSTDTPILLCWFGGQSAVLVENFSEKVIGQICHEVLCYHLTISSKLNPIINILKSGWHTNRFIRGSYSYYSTKSSTQHGELLRAPYAPDGV